MRLKSSRHQCSGKAQFIQDQILFFEHLLSFFLRHMVIANQMKHAVRDKEGIFTYLGMPVFLRLGINSVRADHKITEKQASGFRILVRISISATLSITTA